MAAVATKKRDARYARELRNRRRTEKERAIGSRDDYKPYDEISVQPGQDPLEAAVYDPTRQQTEAALGQTLAEQGEPEQPRKRTPVLDQAALEQQLRRQLRPIQQRARVEYQNAQQKAGSFLSDSDAEAFQEIADFEKKRSVATSLLSVRLSAFNLARRLRNITEQSGMGPGVFLFILVISIAFDLKDFPLEALQEFAAAGSAVSFGLTLTISVTVWMINTFGRIGWAVLMWLFFSGRSHFITRLLLRRLLLVFIIESIPVLNLITGYTIATLWLKYDLDKQQRRLRKEADEIDREAAAIPNAPQYG